MMGTGMPAIPERVGSGFSRASSHHAQANPYQGDANFVKNSAAFYDTGAAGSAEPPAPGQGRRVNEFESYLAQDRAAVNRPPPSNHRISSSSSSYVANKNAFYGTEDQGKSMNQNAKAFFGVDSKSGPEQQVLNRPPQNMSYSSVK